MPETDAVLTKLSEIGDQIKHVQDVNDRLQTNYDGLDLENMKTTAETAAKALQEIQEMKQTVAAMDFKERMDAIELAISRNGATDTNDPEKAKAYKNAMLGYLRKGLAIDDNVLDMMCEAQIQTEILGAPEEKMNVLKKDLVAGSGPDGGYFILPDRASTISTRIFETSPMRPNCSIVTTVSDTWELPLDDDEADAGWVGEVEARSDTGSPQVGLVKIPVHEVYAQPKATQRMLDDAGFDIEAWLNGKVGNKIGRMENTGFVTGDGSKKPKGFLTYDAWTSAGTYERHKVEQITATGTAGTLDEANDLINLQNSLLEEYQAGASFAMRRATFTSVMQLKDSSGAYLINPFMLKQGTDKILLGSPVIFMADMPAVAANALAVAYANWMDFYTIVDRLGIRVLRDPYTAKPYVKFYTTKRVGGAVTDYSAGKILKINA